MGSLNYFDNESPTWLKDELNLGRETTQLHKVYVDTSRVNTQTSTTSKLFSGPDLTSADKGDATRHF